MAVARPQPAAAASGCGCAIQRVGVLCTHHRHARGSVSAPPRGGARHRHGTAGASRRAPCSPSYTPPRPARGHCPMRGARKTSESARARAGARDKPPRARARAAVAPGPYARLRAGGDRPLSLLTNRATSASSQRCSIAAAAARELERDVERQRQRVPERARRRRGGLERRLGDSARRRRRRRAHHSHHAAKSRAASPGAGAPHAAAAPEPAPSAPGLGEHARVRRLERAELVKLAQRGDVPPHQHERRRERGARARDRERDRARARSLYCSSSARGRARAPCSWEKKSGRRRFRIFKTAAVFASSLQSG